MSDASPEAREAAELLPCPFCGSPADYYQQTPSAFFQVLCSQCSQDGETKEAAAKEWNTRALDAQTEELARLREENERLDKLAATRLILANAQRSTLQSVREENERLTTQLASASKDRDFFHQNASQWAEVSAEIEHERDTLRAEATRLGKALMDADKLAEERLAERNDTEAQFEKARQWNNLCELEMQNLRSIVKDQDEDNASLRARIATLEQQAREMERVQYRMVAIGEELKAGDEAKADACNLVPVPSEHVGNVICKGGWHRRLINAATSPTNPGGERHE